MEKVQLEQMAQLMPLIQERLDAGQTVRFSPMGTSMLPMLRQEIDSVVLSPVPEKLKKYDLPFYRRDDGHFVLHRIVKAGETYTCIGDHQLIYEHGVRRDQMIALATGLYRKGKYYSLDSFGYKLYSRLWHWMRPLRRMAYWCIRIFKAVVRRLKRIFGK
jgi:hypothetical protein